LSILLSIAYAWFIFQARRIATLVTRLAASIQRESEKRSSGLLACIQA
jgi:hypothetical protein